MTSPISAVFSLISVHAFCKILFYLCGNYSNFVQEDMFQSFYESDVGTHHSLIWHVCTSPYQDESLPWFGNSFWLVQCFVLSKYQSDFFVDWRN